MCFEAIKHSGDDSKCFIVLYQREDDERIHSRGGVQPSNTEDAAEFQLPTYCRCHSCLRTEVSRVRDKLVLSVLLFSLSLELGISKTVDIRYLLPQIQSVVHSLFIICCVLQMLSCFPLYICPSSCPLYWLVHLSWLSSLPWLVPLTVSTLGKWVLASLFSGYLKAYGRLSQHLLSHLTCFLSIPTPVSISASDLMM